MCIFLLDFIFCFWPTVQTVPENWLYLQVWSLGIVGCIWTDYEVQVNSGVNSSCIFKRGQKLKWLMLSRFPNSVKFSDFCAYCSLTQPKQLQQVFKVKRAQLRQWDKYSQKSVSIANQRKSLLNGDYMIKLLCPKTIYSYRISTPALW